MATIEQIKSQLGSMTIRQITRDKASGIIDQLTDFVDSIAVGSSSNIPSNSVTSETYFGLTPSAGTSANYSRGNHTHGTPAEPQGGGTPSTTVFGETTFGINSNAGSASSYSRGDHTHGTPTNPVTGHESTYNHNNYLTVAHVGSTTSVHNFDSSGKAPPQSHSHVPGDVTGTAVITTDNRLSDARTPTAHNQDWSTINTGRPTTLYGYGITDAMPLIGTSAATPATTGTMTINMTTDIITITPTGACTFNAAAGGNLGRIVTFVITTSGTTSYTLTWGTNYRKTGTLATGTTSARFFAVSFRYVATNIWQEICRTTVQT